jgi:hypothetical protein
MVIKGRIVDLRPLRGGTTVRVFTEAEQELVIPGLVAGGMAVGQAIEVEVAITLPESAPSKEEESTDEEGLDLDYGGDGYGSGE